MDFKKISQQIRALDKPEKLKILALLAEEGRKSISAVARELNIHFSTTHKYLEQLEAANLVHSKSIKEDRLKRYFYVKDFNIRLSPTELTASAPSEKEPSFKILTRTGRVANYNREQLAAPYYQAGVSQIIIASAQNSLERHLYNGITTSELNKMFKDTLSKQTENLASAIQNIQASRLQRNAIASMFEHFAPHLLELHRGGDIFITNLGEPCLLNFAHDIRGIAIHGLQGERAKTLDDLFKQILDAIRITNKFNMGPDSLDSFNYFIAPLVKTLSDDQIKDKLSVFLGDLNDLKKKIFLGVDIGIPEFSKHITPVFVPMDYERKGVKLKTYGDYENTAKKIYSALIDLLREKRFANIKLVLKKWSDGEEIPALKGHFIANMSPKWQTLNANYIGGDVRFDYDWKPWLRTARVGEAQSIAINLPRLALKTKNEDLFITELEKLVSTCIEAHLNMAELLQGHFMRNRIGTNFKSSQKSSWTYAHIDDSLYTISVVGLNECISILSKKPLYENLELANKILATCNSAIGGSQPIRLAIKNNIDKCIADRFHARDTAALKASNIKIGHYSVGTECLKPECSATLHKYLLGGHCVSATKEVLLSGTFGLAKFG